MNNKGANLQLSDYIREIAELFPDSSGLTPWQITPFIEALVARKIQTLSADFRIKGNLAIHKTAFIEEHAMLKGPLIISQNCFVAAHSYLRQGVYLGDSVRLGPGCELKSTLVFSNTALAHFNYVGDSLLGSSVNMEAGSVVANCFNERISKEVEVIFDGQRIKTGLEKFGALVGDGTKIGANAVLSPGTMLFSDSIVRRLELVEQIK